MTRSIIISLLLLHRLMSLPLSVYLNTARIAFYNERDFARAKKACLEGIKKGEKNFELYAILAGSEIGLGNWQEAGQALISSMAIDSIKSTEWIAKQKEGKAYYYQAFFFSARELFEKQEYEAALGYISRALPDVSTHTLKGAILYKLGKTEEANNEYLKAFEIDPENPDINFMIGKVHFDMQAYDSCTRYLEIAGHAYDRIYLRLLNTIIRNVAPPNTGMINTVNNLWKEKNLEELDRIAKNELGFAQGLVEIKSTVEQFAKATDDLARTYFYTGIAYHNLENETLALARLGKVLELKPEDIDARYFMGEVLIALVRYLDAKPHFEIVVKTKPDDSYAWFYIGVCEAQLKNYDSAIAIFENKVLPLNPANVDAMTNLSALYNALGNTKKANEYLHRADSLLKRN